MANGGIIGTDNDPTMAVKITSFTSSGTFNGNDSACNLLVVAGGGGGAYAGGGAGGYRAINPHPLPSSPVTVTIGAGGAISLKAGGAISAAAGGLISLKAVGVIKATAPFIKLN